MSYRTKQKTNLGAKAPTTNLGAKAPTTNLGAKAPTTNRLRKESHILNQIKAIEKSMKMNYYLYRYFWPTYRVLVKHKLSNRCAICALNENCVRISDSVCEICRKEHTSKLATQAAEFSNNPAAEKELDELLTEAQGKGGGLYDAMFLFSGGKDSTYILNRLKTRYKQLRLVALTVDNGFRSPIGKQNAERICEHLDVDHLEIRPYQIFKKLYKYGFENFSHHGFVCTDFWEGELFQDIGRNLAAQLTGHSVIDFRLYARTSGRGLSAKII